jgi:hypothetical protein
MLLSTVALASDAKTHEASNVFETADRAAFSLQGSAAASDKSETQNMSQREHFVDFLTMSSMAYNADQSAVENKMAGYRVQSFKARTGIGEGNEAHFGYVFSKVVNDKLQVYIATRGTRTLEDGITDGRVAMSVLSSEFQGPDGAFVHTGFQNAALSAQSGIRTCLETLQETYGDFYRSAEISMCGHSLGAAMTLLNSAWLKTQTNLAPSGVEEIVTFGLPSPGNLELIQHLGGTTKKQSNFYQRQDPVSRLKANDSYVYPMNCVSLPSQDVTVDPLLTHKLAGYSVSLDAYFGLKPHTVGIVSATLDHPLVNAILVPTFNTFCHVVWEWMKDPETQRDGLKLLFGKLREFCA